MDGLGIYILSLVVVNKVFILKWNNKRQYDVLKVLKTVFLPNVYGRGINIGNNTKK